MCDSGLANFWLIISALFCTFTLCRASLYVDTNWVHTNLTAFSIQPKIMCNRATLPSSQLTVRWMVPSKYSAAYRLEVNGIRSAGSEEAHTIRLKLTADKVIGSVVHLRAIRSTSYGDAVLPVNLEINEAVLSRKSAVRYTLQLSPELTSDGKSFQMYRFSWYASETTSLHQGSMDLILIYNRTHVMQHESNQGYLFLSSLVPGSVYKLCVIESAAVCSGDEWSCVTRTTPVPIHSMLDGTISVRHLTLVHRSETSAQISWSPSSRSLLWRGVYPPRCYLIVAQSHELSDDCLFYYIRAPWIQVADQKMCTEAINTTILKFTLRDGCTARKNPQLLQPLGVWPDWEKYAEQEDELGPVGEFTVPVPALLSNVTYDIHVTPITSGGHVQTSTLTVRPVLPADECKLELEVLNSTNNLLKWSVTTALLNKWKDNHLEGHFRVRLRRLGRPMAGELRESCFVKSCNITENLLVPRFEQVRAGEAQMLRCYEATISLNLSSPNQSVLLPCLLPYELYHAQIFLRVPNATNLDQITCQKRLVQPGHISPGPHADLRVKVLSHNLFVLHLPGNIQSPTYDYCPTIGYAITLEDIKTDIVAGPLLVTKADLELGFQVPLLGQSEAERRSDRFSLLLHNPLENTSKLQVKAMILSACTTDQPTSSVRFQNKPPACQMHCVWPFASPFTLTSTIERESSIHRPYTKHQDLHDATHSPRFINCTKWTIRAGALSTPCHTVPDLLAYSDHAFCQLDKGWGTCSVPRCTDMALLTCPPELLVTTNTTALRVAWDGLRAWDSYSPSVTPDGLVLILSVPPTVGNRGTECIRADLLLPWAGSGKYEQSRFLDSFLGACPELPSSAKTTDVQFIKLRQNTSYELRVTAFDKDGRLGGTWLQNVRTQPAAPCAPEGVSITHAEPRALKMNWRLPVGDDCGPPTEILLHYRPSDVHDTQVPDPRPLKLALEPTLRLPSLLPCTEYCVQLQLVNEVKGSLMSQQVCRSTTRPAFSQPPSVEISIVSIQSSDTVSQWMSQEYVKCHLLFRLEYDKSCPVRYEVELGVYNTQKTELQMFNTDAVEINDLFQLGLLYRLRVRALSVDYAERRESHTSSNTNHVTIWSPPIDLFTGMAPVKLTNVQIKVHTPVSIQDRTLCVPQLLRHEDGHDRVDLHKVVESGAEDMCFHVRLDLESRPLGLMGLLVLLFGESASDSHNTDETLQESAHHPVGEDVATCIQMFWVPCENCLSPTYSLRNAHQDVLNRIFQSFGECTALRLPTLSGSRIHMTPSSHVLSSETVDRLLNLLKTVAIASVSVYQTTVDLIMNVSRTTVTVPTSHTGVQSRSVRSISFDQSPMQTSEVDRGTIRLYTVNAFSVTLLSEHLWHLNVTRSASSSPMNAASWIGVSVGILLLLAILVWFLVAFDSQRRHHFRLSKMQRASEFGCSDPEDEEVALQLEAKQPIVPPRISKFLLRPPDPVSVHDFVTWCDKQRYNNFASLREEFKSLRSHSMRQEQAKRLTRNVGLRPENRLRNKYRNLVPFDHNYVHLLKPWRLVDLNKLAFTESDARKAQPSTNLEQSEENAVTGDRVEAIANIPEVEQFEELGPEQWIASDYVNASLIHGRAPGLAHRLVESNLLPRTYIAAQAPLLHTRGLFWQMVWDHGVKLIVLLTRLKEDSKEKCSQYWPGSSGESEHEADSSTPPRTLGFNHLTITLLEVLANPVYIKRKFSLHNSLAKDKSPRIITQLHMLQWSDFSAPTHADFTSILYAYWTERRCCSSLENPILVHCSAGIGRTGTFICLDQLCQQVRYYIQPNFQVLDLPPSLARSSNWDEPVYVNLKEDMEDTAAKLNSDHLPYVTDNSLSKTSPDIDASTNEPNVGVRLSLLRNGDSRSTGRKRLLALGRRKSQCIDVYKTVLWLRSNRGYMVQSETQYLFVYQYLSYFIQKINDSEQIYANI